MTYNFTLHSGITFADGEPLNSTAVYFSLNRLLVADGSSQVAHGIRAAWIIQQLLNTSLSTQLCTCNEVYNTNYVNAVLAENFVQITGPYSFTIHVMHPNTAFQFLLAGEWADIVAPDYVMQHDLAAWSQASQGYTLPYPTPSGNATTIVNEYLDDIAATCNAGATPNGCGAPYLDGSYQGSLAGSGPYTITSIGQTSNDIVLQANQNYWGGPNQFTGGSKIVPQMKTIDINYVPATNTRELDIQNAAHSGQAMTVDIPNTNLYDVVNRQAWLNNNTMTSIFPGITVYGPEVAYTDIFDAFSTNVTNFYTHDYYSFQPFSDQRFRLAFADAINVSAFNTNENDNLGQVEIDAIPPGLPPQGSYNSSITPKYSFNPDQSAQLLLNAMEHPITQFNFRNGTAAPAGLFNNTFGCSTLNSNGQCSNPVQQTIQLTFPVGWYDENSLLEMSQVINNISSTYNMGLSVSVSPLPFGQMFSEVDTGSVYMFSTGWFDDYPWVTDFLGPIYFSGGNWPSETNWNLTAMNTLYHEAINASEVW